jgi:uncharacterized protein (UPF0303 family)
MTLIVNMIWQLSGEIRHKWKTREMPVRYDMSLYFLELFRKSLEDFCFSIFSQ